MQPQPDFPLMMPPIQKLAWQSVRQSKSDEVRSAILLPVRQAVFCVFDLGERIKELKLVVSVAASQSPDTPLVGGREAAALGFPQPYQQ